MVNSMVWNPQHSGWLPSFLSKLGLTYRINEIVADINLIILLKQIEKR
ncbi:MAG: hypothetical protein QXN81_00310 [Candidatus Bathyarchaeia archaeon]